MQDLNPDHTSMNINHPSFVSTHPGGKRGEVFVVEHYFPGIVLSPK